MCVHGLSGPLAEEALLFIALFTEVILLNQQSVNCVICSEDPRMSFAGVLRNQVSLQTSDYSCYCLNMSH